MDKETSTVRVPRELHKRAKALAAMQGRPVEQVYADLLREYLEKASELKIPQPTAQ